MASVNKVTILGNLTRDPETRATSGGMQICNVSIATNRKWKSKSGEKQEEVEFHRVVFFDRLAEIAGQYLAKGRPVYVEGRLKTNKWSDKDGVERYSTDIIATEMQLLGGGQEERSQTPGRQPAGRAQPSRQPSAPPSDPFTGGAGDLDDVPFQNPYRGKLSYVV